MKRWKRYTVLFKKEYKCVCITLFVYIKKKTNTVMVKGGVGGAESDVGDQGVN